MPVNETEIIQNISALAGGRTVASQRTLVGQLPFVKNVEDEIDRINKEREESMSEFGEGLFDQQMGATQTPQEGQQDTDANGGGVNAK